MIDTHAHLDSEEFDKDRVEVIQRAFDNGVSKIINIGNNIASSEQSIELAGKYNGIYTSVGVFPEEVKELDDDSKNSFLQLAKSSDVVAIGECGLDYFVFDERETGLRQKKLFEFQIGIAEKLDLPLIVHARNAHDDILKILRLHQLKKKGVMHCFLGNWEQAQAFLDLGFYISFTGAITYKKKEGVWEVIKKMPIDKMMIETDCPYLTPQVFRGQRNEPAYVKYVAEKIAEVRGIGFDEVAKATYNNSVKLFNLK